MRTSTNAFLGWTPGGYAGREGRWPDLAAGGGEFWDFLELGHFVLVSRLKSSSNGPLLVFLQLS